jgi:hypothetical protein
LIHSTDGHATFSGAAYELPWWLFGIALIVIHLVRALIVNRRTAERWMQQRGLETDERSAEQVRRHLLRLRWSRVMAAVALVVICSLSLAWARTAISFLSLPFLLSVLVAETLAPEPRRARLRVAGLRRRPPSYFAPVRALVATRIALAVGVVLSFAAGVVSDERWQTSALVHGTVLLVGAVALEVCLSRISSRALPDRQPDLSVDSALRVASARAATAAGLVFGSVGLMLAATFAAATGSGPPSMSDLAIGQLAALAVLGAVAVALGLVQPLRSWHPREQA